MSIAEDIKTLRARGESDDAILDTYKAIAPHHSKDVDTLLQRGEKAGDILDTVMALPEPKSKEPEQGTLSKVTGAIRESIGNQLGGYSDSAEEALGKGATSSFLKTASEAIKDRDYKTAEQGQAQAQGLGDKATYLPRMALEASTGIGTDLAAGAAGAAAGSLVPFIGTTLGGIGGFGASYLARNWGSKTKEIAEKSGHSEATTGDKLSAGLISGGEAALSRLGLKGAIGEAVKGAGSQAIGQIAKATGKGIASEVAANAASDVGSQFATNVASGTPGDPIDLGRTANAAGTGAVVGAGVRAVRGSADAYNAAKYRDVDAEAGTRVANRLADKDLTDPSKAYQAVETTKAQIKSDISNATKELREYLSDQRKATDGTDETRPTIDKALKFLDGGGVLSPETIEAVRAKLPASERNTENIVRALEDHSELNRVVGKAKVDHSTQTITGGLSESGLGRALNPLNLARRIGLVGGAGVGAAAFPNVSGLVTSPVLAASAATALKAGAGLGAAYGGLRVVDATLGTRNPVKEFTKRFSDYKNSAPNDLPTYLQMTREQREKEAALGLAQAATDRASKVQERAEKKASQLENGIALSEERAAKEAEAQTRDEQAKRESDTELAYRAKAKAEAVAKAQAEARDRAFAANELSPEQKAAQEEAMWAQAQPAPAPGGWDENHAANVLRKVQQAQMMQKLQEGLLRGERSKKAQEGEQKAKETDADRAYRERDRQNTQAEKASKQSDAAWEQHQSEQEAARKAEEAKAWKNAPKDEPAPKWDDEYSQFVQSQANRAKAKKAEAAEQLSNGKAVLKGIKLRDRLKTKAEKDEAKANKPEPEPKEEPLVSTDVKKSVKAILDKEKMRLKSEASDQQAATKAERDAENAQKAEERTKAKTGRDEEKSRKDAMNALLYRERMKRKALSEAETEAGKAERAAKAAEAKAPKPAKESLSEKAKPKQPEPDAGDGEMLRVVVGDQVVERPKKGIDFPEAYKAKTRKRMEERAAMSDELIKLVGERHAHIVKGMLGRLNNASESFADANGHISEAMNELPEKNWSAAWDIVNKHEAKIRGTYKE